jgi:hypothetical protein
MRRFGTTTARPDAATASNIAKATSSAASPHADHSPSWALMPSPIRVQATSVTTVGQTGIGRSGVAGPGGEAAGVSVFEFWVLEFWAGNVASLSPDI